MRKFQYLFDGNLPFSLLTDRSDSRASVGPLRTFFLTEVFSDPQDKGRRLRAILKPDRNVVDEEVLAQLYVRVVVGLVSTMFGEDGWVTRRLIGTESFTEGARALRGGGSLFHDEELEKEEGTVKTSAIQSDFEADDVEEEDDDEEIEAVKSAQDKPPTV